MECFKGLMKTMDLLPRRVNYAQKSLYTYYVKSITVTWNPSVSPRLSYKMTETTHIVDAVIWGTFRKKFQILRIHQKRFSSY